MRCARCGSDNPDDKRFCGDCGAALALRCPKCGVENLFDKKFCGDCGASLVQQPKAEEKAEKKNLVADLGSTGERRHLTVLFCDLADSTALTSRMDPEDWRAAVGAYHRLAAEAISRFGGHVAKYLGDGVMAFFGYPEAHDNDAERAIRASLAILDALSRLNEASVHPKLEARIGIDSGPVVVDVGAGQDPDVFGDTPNIAARAQSAAEPNSVLVSSSTHDLVSGLFLVHDSGPHSLKGLAEPLNLYRILRPSGARGRLEAHATARGLTPFVGREDELRLLSSRWERARDGEGQVALIIGEGGIGKSRLVHRFRQTLTDQSYLWIDAAAGALFRNSPFYPVSEMLRRALFAGGTGAPDGIAQLAGALRHAGLEPTSAVPVLGPLLNLQLTPEYSPSSLPPEQQRRRLLALLVDWIVGTARQQPLIIALEDLHWADPSTLELLELLVEQGNRAPLFLLFTARPEFHPSWPLRAHHAHLTLNRLGSRDIRTMVAQVAAQKALTGDTITAVVERTGGVPLFIEELTRAVLESGEAKLAGRAIPATLHDSLMARLDRLGPAKETIQIGAVLGSEFSYELLHAVHLTHDHDALQRHLRALIDAELLYVRGLAPDATYQFKHALIRDAAYEALLKSRRRELHRLVAQTIDSQFSAIKENNPEVLAHHWTEAAELASAITAWQKAAESADARGAFLEAADGYQKALALIDELGDLDELRLLELELASSLVRVLTITRGLTAAESVTAAAHARSVAEKSGSLAKLILREYANWNAVFASGNLADTAALAARLLELALHEGGPTTLAFAHQAKLTTAFFRGELIELEEHFERFSLLCDQADFSEFPAEKLCGFTFASVADWILGKPDTARARMSKGLACAHESGHPYELAFGLFFEAWLCRLLREYEQAEASAAQCISISQKHDFSLVRDIASSLMGGIIITQPAAEDRLAITQRGLDSLIAAGARAGITDFLYCLAMAREQAGMREAAEKQIDDALIANLDEKACLPNLLTYRGKLRLLRQAVAAAETDFRDAITLAQSMSAKSWELRATTFLARLLRDTDRRDEAHLLLSTIYNWFTEGRDTADLIDAKALLDELR